MGKLRVSLDGVVIQEVQITKATTTLGRRPYNDIVIDNLTVSGEHALLHKVGQTVYIEDLNSTNGTYINGKAIRKQQLSPLDAVEIGRYKINFLLDTTDPTSEQAAPETGMAEPDGTPSSLTNTFLPPAVPGEPDKAGGASIKVLSGAAAGRTVVLTKAVTTVGKPGVLVGCALTDVLRDGLSMVYSFFHTGEESRSLGTHMILDHIAAARQRGLPNVYLGYWVEGSEKMNYKAKFGPLEALGPNGWARLGSSGQ